MKQGKTYVLRIYNNGNQTDRVGERFKKENDCANDAYYMYTHIYIYIYICIYIYMCVCVYIYVCIFIYIHILLYVNTYT